MDEVIDLMSDEDDEDSVLVVVPPPPVLDNACDYFQGNFIPVFQHFGFVLPGKPESWSRPKVFTRVLGNNAYKMNAVNINKEKTKRIRDFVNQGLVAGQQEGMLFGSPPQPIFATAPVHLELEFHWPLANYFFVGSNRSNPLRDNIEELKEVPANRRPDIDNLAKLVIDALEGIFYADDKQVVKITASKCLDLEPPHDGRTVIKIRMAGPNDMPH